MPGRTIQGPPGPAGPQGAPGAGVNFKGALPGGVWSAPASPEPGDIWTAGGAITGGMVAAQGDGIQWNGASWVNIGPFQGPVGPAGPAGAAGAVGPAGPQGPTGAAGAAGAPGATGPAGPAGAAGAAGPTGPAGPAGPPGSGSSAEYVSVDDYSAPTDGTTNSKSAFDTAAAAALAATPPRKLLIPARTYALSTWDIPAGLTVVGVRGAKLVPTAFTGSTAPNTSPKDSVAWINMKSNTELNGVILDMKYGAGITRPGGNEVIWNALEAWKVDDVRLINVEFRRCFGSPFHFCRVNRPVIKNILTGFAEKGYQLTKCWGSIVEDIRVEGFECNVPFGGTGFACVFRHNFYTKAKGLRFFNLKSNAKLDAGSGGSGHSYVHSVLNLWGDVGSLFTELQFIGLDGNSMVPSSCILMDGVSRTTVSNFLIEKHNMGASIPVAIEGGDDATLENGYIEGLRIPNSQTGMEEFGTGFEASAGVYVHAWKILTMGDGDPAAEYWTPGYQNRGRSQAANIRIRNVAVHGFRFGIQGAGCNFLVEGCDLRGNKFAAHLIPTHATDGGYFGSRVVTGQQGRNIQFVNCDMRYSGENALRFSGIGDCRFVNCDLRNAVQDNAGQASVATLVAQTGSAAGGGTTTSVPTTMSIGTANQRVNRSVYFPNSKMWSIVRAHTTGLNVTLTVEPALPAAPTNGEPIVLAYGIDGDITFDGCQFGDTQLNRTVTEDWSFDPTEQCNSTDDRLTLCCKKMGEYSPGQTIVLKAALNGGGDLSVKLLRQHDYIPDCWIGRPFNPGGSEVFAKSPAEGSSIVGGTGLLSYTLNSGQYNIESRLVVTGNSSTKFAEEIDWCFFLGVEVTTGNWEWRRCAMGFFDTTNNRTLWVGKPFSASFSNRPFRIVKPNAVLPKTTIRKFALNGTAAHIIMRDCTNNGQTSDDVLTNCADVFVRPLNVGTGATTLKIDQADCYTLGPGSAKTYTDIVEGAAEGRKIWVKVTNGNVTLNFTSGTKLKGYPANQTLTSGQCFVAEFFDGFWFIRIY